MAPSTVLDFGVYPHLYLTFSEGNIGGPRASDPANERPCLSQAKNHFKNIGCGGEKMRNLALNRHTDIIILLGIPLGITLFGKPSDYLMNVMQLRCEKVAESRKLSVVVSSKFAYSGRFAPLPCTVYLVMMLDLV